MAYAPTDDSRQSHRVAFLTMAEWQSGTDRSQTDTVVRRHSLVANSKAMAWRPEFAAVLLSEENDLGANSGALAYRGGAVRE